MTGPEHQEDQPQIEDDFDSERPSSVPRPSQRRAPPLTRPALVFLLAVSGVSLALDLASKFWAVATLADGSVLAVSPGMLSLRVAYNPGGAFSMLASADSAIRQVFFIAVNIFAIYFILRLYRRLEPSQHALRWGLPLVLGGALGNFADRLTRGHVIDFIEYRSGWVEWLNGLINKVYSSWFVTDQWPTFNLADVWIVVGVLLILVDSWRPKRTKSQDDRESQAPSVS